MIHTWISTSITVCQASGTWPIVGAGPSLKRLQPMRAAIMSPVIKRGKVQGLNSYTSTAKWESGATYWIDAGPADCDADVHTEVFLW